MLRGHIQAMSKDIPPMTYAIDKKDDCAPGPKQCRVSLTLHPYASLYFRRCASYAILVAANVLDSS